MKAQPDHDICRHFPDVARSWSQEVRRLQFFLTSWLCVVFRDNMKLHLKERNLMSLRLFSILVVTRVVCCGVLQMRGGGNPSRSYVITSSASSSGSRRLMTS